MKKLYLLDSFALIFRAYYALMKSPRITSTGKNTNAQFGFTNTILEILNKEKPTHIAAAFDTAAPTERHIAFADYKANRQETPEDILSAVPDIKTILRGLNIPILEMNGYEADDIVGTIAVQAAAQGFDVFMVSPDKDYGQMVSDKISIYKPAYQKNERQILGVKEVCEMWGIDRTEQLIDILGLMGDAVDNIPGVAGIGEKTASKLIKEYGSIENILTQVDNIKGAVGDKLRQHQDKAILSKQLATINLSVPLAFDATSYAVSPLNKEILTEIFTDLEFKTLGKRILGDDFGGQVATPKKNKTTDLFSIQEDTTEPISTIPSNYNNALNTPHEYLLVNSMEEIVNLKNHLQLHDTICMDTETTGLDTMLAELVGISFCVEPHKAFYIPFAQQKQDVLEQLAPLKPLFEDKSKLWIGQNLKYDMAILQNYHIRLEGNIYDTMLLQYLLDSESKKGMNFLSMKYLNYQPIEIETLIGEKGKKQKSMRDVDIETIKEYASEDADITFQLWQYFEHNHLADDVTKKLFNEIEIPLSKVLLDVERNGVNIDTPFLEELSIQLDGEIKSIEQDIFALTGSVFNISSPKQLGDVLFQKLNIQGESKLNKTKTGQISTDDSILEKFLDKHPVIAPVMQYRELTKLKSTYVDALPLLVNPHTQKIHTTFHQSKAVTGRLSSINPNLQNIPVRTELGKQMRKAFIPQDNHLLMSADYSQIELRIVAALSNDENMIQAFRDKKDIHTATASKIYHVVETDVQAEMRYKAKSVNFGIIYGQGAWGLSQNIKVPQKEAKALIENYFLEYPHIKKLMDEQIAFAREHGFVETLSGRRRWLRDINSANATVRGFAERNAINMPIQGTAADMIKLAMIAIQKAMTKKGLASKMILQVHDELLFDVPLQEQDVMQQLVQTLMPKALELPHGVPVEIEIGFGKNWLEAH